MPGRVSWNGGRKRLRRMKLERPKSIKEKNELGEMKTETCPHFYKDNRHIALGICLMPSFSCDSICNDAISK